MQVYIDFWDVVEKSSILKFWWRGEGEIGCIDFWEAIKKCST